LLDKRETRIRRMFGNIAPSYDFLNHLLSANIDHYWRWRTTRLAPPSGSDPILDLCTGTGDLALAYDRAAGGRVPIVGADFCHEMLVLARRKTHDRRLADRIRFLEADAQRLPFPDNSFQITTVAFGLRNVTDTERGLAEMARVTRPGGKVAILEFSQPRGWLFGRLYRFYFRYVLPLVGQAISRSKDRAYLYLPASVTRFPDGEALAARLRAHGLKDVRYYPFTFGIATLYVGTKP
jgi:demethylmenaquinone methyltransferase/2-methoxy-6-polyprenyl-1,4-benzoquinol methylase